jgi:hypothetical protein
MNKIDEFVGHFHILNLKYAERVKGFDPSSIFVEHLLAVDFNNYLLNAILNEYGDDVLHTLTRDTGDLEMILNTNESYKQRGNILGEKSAHSPTITPKSTTSLSSVAMAHKVKKETHNYSGGRGDKNPSSGKIESSHKLPVRKKRKNNVQEEEGP